MALPAALGAGMAAEDFKATREALGVDRKQLAVLLDSNERLLCRWENGEMPVPHVIAILVRLVLAGRVSLNEIAPL